MNLSTYIDKLIEIHEIHGNIHVKTWGFSGITDANIPTLEYMATLKPRETKPRLWRDNNERQPGERIVYV